MGHNIDRRITCTMLSVVEYNTQISINFTSSYRTYKTECMYLLLQKTETGRAVSIDARRAGNITTSTFFELYVIEREWILSAPHLFLNYFWVALRYVAVAFFWLSMTGLQN